MEWGTGEFPRTLHLESASSLTDCYRCRYRYRYTTGQSSPYSLSSASPPPASSTGALLLSGSGSSRSCCGSCSSYYCSWRLASKGKARHLCPRKGIMQCTMTTWSRLGHLRVVHVQQTASGGTAVNQHGETARHNLATFDRHAQP